MSGCEHPSLLYALPFAGLLLSIALGPLAMPHFWEHHQGKIAAAWVLAFVVPAVVSCGFQGVAHELLKVALSEYVPFLLLVTALFVTAGGIVVDGRLAGTPWRSTGLLAAGAFLASILGTTGASMVLVRPLLKGLSSRRRKVHTVIFFIFLVSNIGGCLTPVGDPPLFLGFLNGVPFLWTLHALPAMLFVTASLLVIHFAIDWRAWWKETDRTLARVEDAEVGFGIRGKRNLGLLLLVVLTVLLSGLWPDAASVVLAGVAVPVPGLVRDVVLLAVLLVSVFTTSPRLHQANSFSWGPVQEVAKLFAGIFVCLVPIMEILREGTHGPLGWLIASVTSPLRFFWASGILSSFLDNAPTYLLFFHVAGGAHQLSQLLSEGTTLLAISLGSVFMGANSYIGNEPNFLVKTIAQDHGVKMPSFGGYLLWSGGILVPLFCLTGWIFF